MNNKNLLRQSLMANQTNQDQSGKSLLRRSLEVQQGVAPGTFSPVKTAPQAPAGMVQQDALDINRNRNRLGMSQLENPVGRKDYTPITLESMASNVTPSYVSPFAKNDGYQELSRYKSTKNSKDVDNRNFIDKAIDWIIGASDNENSKKYSLVNGFTTEDYDDELYEYINKNPDVVSRVNANEATSGQYFSGVDQSFLQEMEDAEIADYNYLYATQGKDKANEFLQGLKKDLTKRQMGKYVTENQQYAREHPVAASAWSVLSKPLEGVSLAGQLMDYKLDRDMDPNAGYNRFVKQNQTIRQTVPENWSKVGQFLYGTGMSIVDNLYNMALTGAFGNVGGLGEGAQSLILGIMGSSAAAESTLNALENGYSADRAMLQGAIAGGIEVLTEKISLETLLSPNAFKDGTIKYLLKNAAAEGSEEGASTVANWVVDWIGDLITDENRSDFRQVFTAFDRGDTKEGWRKIGEMGLDLAQDVAGGALSGGVLAGAGSVSNTIGNINLGSALNQTSELSDMSEFVNDSYADSLKNPDATRYQKQLSQRALEQFYNDGKVSNRTLGELAQNNMYMAEEQANTVNLLNEASQRINQGKQITSSQMREILDNKQAVRTLRDNYGLRLNDNMSYSDRFNAVQDALTNRLNSNDAQVKLGFRADMVAKFAKTLGSQGERTLNAMARANGYEDVEAFSKGYTQIYNAVKADPEVKLNDLSVKADYSFTPQQLNTIYKSAVKDYEADLKKTGLSYEGETNAEETATGSQNSGTDGVGTVSLDSEVATGSVAGRAAEVESRRKAADVRIESIRNNAALNSIAEVTSAEAGIPGGVNTDQAKTVRVLSESQWSALDTDTYNFLHELKDMGYEVKAWTGTALAYDEMSGKNAAVRGFIQGNTIGVRVDANLSARKIAYHEMFHDMVKTDSSLQADMVKKINEHYGEGKLETIVRDYVSQYGWTKASSEEILNEIFADAYAGIDIYEDLEMNYEGATQVSSDVRGFLSENGVKTRNGRNAGQFSMDSDGNDISPGQAEYFKDSKIRDEDGNLQIVYHGTDADFTVFDRTKGRSNMDIQGSFFSPWEIDAGGYGSNVKAYYLDIKNPAPESVAYRALNRFKGQNNAGVKAREYLERLGYDGVNNGNEEYIAFYPEQIKEVENANPTSDPDVRFSRDTSYMDAVNSGDMETAQRMVDEAARDAGYNYRGYHGTDKNFTVFRPGKALGWGEGIYVASDAEDAKNYGKNIMPVYLKINNPYTGQTIKAENTQAFKDYVYNYFKKIATDEYITVEEAMEDRVPPAVTDMVSDENANYLNSALRELGYDGIIMDGSNDITGTEMVVFDPSQIKSADPVTYDDNGNVIPLSERFNAESNDIRFSRDTSGGAFNELYTTLEDGRIKPNNVEDLSTEDWKLIYKAVNKLGYGLESVKQTKEIYSRYVGENGFNKEQSEAIKKAYGVTETSGIAANPKREALARKTFGTTGDFREAGYLMRNGSMLDFSGKKDGGPAHVRYMDHREIGSVFSQGEIPGEKTQYGDNAAYMNAFISEGNIRLMEGQGVTIGEMEPTSQQYTILKQFIDHVLKNEDYFYLDLSNNDGYTVASRDYSSSDGAQKIIRDIKEYFKNGELPYRSDLAQFRYSRDTTGMESELQKQNRELSKELKEVTERYHYFKDQLVLTKVRQATEQSANRVAKQLVKDYSSNVSADEIAKALREASKLVMNVKDDTDIDELRTQLKDALRPYAMQMVTNASELINAEDVKIQKSIRNDLRNGAGIIVTDQMKKDVPDWASFRKAQFGNMKLVSGSKTNIHDVYLELSQKYGEGYFPQDVTNESDMLQVIADVMADLSAIYDNPYTYGGANIAEAIESCTNDMMMSVVGSLEAEQPTFADKKQAEKKEALRKQAIKLRAEALERVKEQRDRTWEKASAKYKKRIKSIYDKRQQYELRGKIRKKVKDLSGKLLRPTDDKHIPYALQGAVVDLLSAINTGSAFDLDYNDSATRVERGTGMATQKTTAWARLQRQLSDFRDQLVLDGDLFDTDDQPGILTDLSGLTNTSIDSMDTETLQKVLTVLRNCETAIRSYNQMISESKWAEISEASEAIHYENADKVGRPEYQPALEKTINLLTVDMDTPEAFFGRMGNAGKALFKMLRAAQDENIRILKEAQNFSQENGLYDLKLKDYEQKTVTVRFGNRDVEMSKAQLMELYILNKREAAGAHIDVGGILPEPVQKKWSLKKVTYSEPIRNMTQEDIARAMTQLSPEDIKIAEAMQEFVSTVMTKHGNDAAMRVYGYKKFGEENYWPIRVNDQDLRTELGTVRTRARSVSKKGFTNAIKPNAKQSVVIGSIFDTFNEHVAEMANYASHLAVMEDMKRIYNFTEKNEDGAIEVSTKYTLRNVFGPQGTKYFEKLMQDLSNGTVSEQAYFGGLIGRFKAAAVGSNLRVILQQPTAIFRAMDMISPKYLAQGFLHVKIGREKALKNAPIAQWKDWGYFDINTGRSTKNILFENSSTLDRVQNVLMAGAGKADSVSWGALYAAVEAETKDQHPELRSNSKAFDQFVAERFADIIDHSQVVDGVLQRSGIMRSENAIDKMATSFMAEPTKQFNMLSSAIYNFRNAGENKAQAGKVLARTTAAMLFAGLLNAAVQSIVDAIRDDDPEKDYWEKFLAKFTGDEATFSSFLTSNVGDFLNPAQYVPYAKDIVSIIQGYDVERMDVSLINDLYTDGKAMVNAFQGKGKYSMTNTIMNFMNTAAKFLGLSTGNVKRDMAGIMNTFAQNTGNKVMMYRMAKFTYNLNQATNKGRFVEILAQAYKEDRKAFDIILNDLIKEDKFATTTMTTREWIVKRLKEKHDIIIK